ncbi:MAG TPA: integrase arm-type DNA-binding domain-containing protein [Fluviicoccus sp.]|nr:integrase arm-type DNA-binding domain-containing protein [Fluviicoccus sp.]
MPLTDSFLRTLKPPAKQEKHADTGGLFILATPNGGKWWRLKYRFGGKEKLLSMGTYPEVSLKAARERRDEARAMLAEGMDPGIERKARKAARGARDANSFEAVAREWLALKMPGWAASHGDKVKARLEQDVFPWIGGRPIAEVTGPELLAVARRIAARGALDTAHRALQTCGQIIRHAIHDGRAERDPVQDLRGALPAAKTQNFAAVTEPSEVAGLLRMFDDYRGTLVTRCALRLAPLVFVRPGELRAAEWKDIDLEEGEWRYLVSKTKTEHIVPLSRQSVAILRELHPLTSHARYVFPSPRTDEKPMSDNAILSALRRMNIPKEEMTGHGFRAMARTLLHERLKFPPEIIEHQLAHSVPDALGTAYNRTRFLDDRKAMMQAWADYLDKLKAGAEIIPLSSRRA